MIDVNGHDVATAEGFEAFLKQICELAGTRFMSETQLIPHAFVIGTRGPSSLPPGAVPLMTPKPENSDDPHIACMEWRGGMFDDTEKFKFSLQVRYVCASTKAIGVIFFCEAMKVMNVDNLPFDEFYKKVQEGAYPKTETISAVVQHYETGHMLYEALVSRDQDNNIISLGEWQRMDKDLTRTPQGSFSNMLLPRNAEELVQYMRCVPTQRAQEALHMLNCLYCGDTLDNCQCVHPIPRNEDVNMLMAISGIPLPNLNSRPVAKA